jgi:hypothetical protein
MFKIALGIWTTWPADGVVFMLHSNMSIPGGLGGGMGYGGINNSVGIEVDPYYNAGWDPSMPAGDHHIGIDVNGSVTSLRTAIYPVGIHGGISALADSWVWVDYVGGVMSIYVNNSAVKPGSPTLTLTIDIRTFLVLA